MMTSSFGRLYVYVYTSTRSRATTSHPLIITIMTLFIIVYSAVMPSMLSGQVLLRGPKIYV